MGRNRIDLNKDDIKEALRGRTITEASEYLGIGRTTLVRGIRRLGIGIGRGNYSRRYKRRKKRSLVHRRLVENSGTVLSGDPVALSQVLGISSESIRTYLKRGKIASERFVKEILAKAPKDLILMSVNGDKVPIASINKMSIILDQWGRKAMIIVVTKQNKTKVLKYNIQKLWNILEEKLENDRKGIR